MRREPYLLDLNAIAQEPGASGRYSYAIDFPPSEELEVEGPIAVSLQVQNTGRAMLVMGEFQGKVRLICARCLKEITVPVSGQIAEPFSLPGEASAGLELIDQTEPTEAGFADQILNVTELVRQQVLISLPMRALCEENCRGLCPTCGTDLNVKECDCPKASGHPGWEVLRSLADKRKE